MASRIKGITIEIGGDTQKLEKSLSKVNGKINSTQRELRDVNKLLKLNPGNTELIKQKQVLLGKAIRETKEKIKQEELALKQLQTTGNTEANQQQQRALQRELIDTKGKLQQLENEEKQLGATATATNAKMQRQSKVGNKLKGTLGGIRSKLIGMAGLAAAAFSVGAIVQFGKASLDASAAQTEAETKLETVMKQRMGSSDAQIQKVKDLASAQQNLGVIGDEVQLAGAQQLSTFLGEEASLNTLIPAMNNLAAQQKGVNATSSDMVSIGNLMGKAMQGQTGALRKVGITFDESQEKVLKYGTEEEKAAVLAQVITDNVGNMNAELANTDAGKIQQAKNTFGDMQETIGALLLPILAKLAQTFMPLLEKLSAGFQKLADPASKVRQIISSIKTAFQIAYKIISPALSKLVGQAKKNHAGVKVLNAIIVAFKGIVIATAVVIRGVIAVIRVVIEIIKRVIEVIKRIITVANNVKASLSNLGTKFKTIFSNIKSTVSNAVKAIKEKFGSTWSAIKEKITAPFTKAKEIVGKAVETMKGLFPISLGKIFSGVKLPHFQISGGKIPWGIGGMGTKPSVDIAWYKKGGIFNSPSVIGVGEAGKEAVVPLDKLWKKMDEYNRPSSNVTINVYASEGMDVNELASAVERKLVQTQNRRRTAWA